MAFLELVEDIRYDGYVLYGHQLCNGKKGKKAYLPWKEVLRLMQIDGWHHHDDPAKLKADYKVAKDYEERTYGPIDIGWLDCYKQTDTGDDDD